MKKLFFLSILLSFIISVLQAGTIDVRVNNGSDDMIEEIDSSSLYDENQLDLVVYGGDTPQKIGLRFKNITIPNGANINNAYLEFQANQDNSGQTDITITGENSSNPVTYDDTNNGDITSRTETTAAIDWLSVPAWLDGQTYQTVDITTIIQELVDAGGWQSGNAMALMLKPFDANCNTGECLRQAVSFDGNSAVAPLLHIIFDEPTTPPLMGMVPDTNAHVDLNFIYDLSHFVTPTDGDPILSYDLNGTLPNGLQIDNTTGIISGLPRFTGASTLGLTATDKDGNSSVATFTITVLDSLVADYRLDECFWLGSAYTDVKDHTFNVLNGTSYNNSAIDLNNSRINHSGLFNGTSDYIEVSHSPLFNETDQMSVSFWVYPTRANKDEYYVSKRKNKAGWYLWFDNRSTDRIEFAIRINNGFRKVRINKPAGWTDNWHFISATYDGNHIKLYVDNLTKSSSRTGDITHSTNSLLIGNRYDNKKYFAGNIDEVKIWNSALSDAEVESIFTHESAGNNYNGTTRDTMTCNANIQENTWEIIGIPAEMRTSAVGVQDVFGDDFVGADYDTGAAGSWNMWKRVFSSTDNSEQWVKIDYASNETLKLGEGYFLWSTVNVDWDTNGLVGVDYNSTYNGTDNCKAKHCTEIDLVSLSSDGTDGSGTNRYNLGGFIGNSPVEWRNCRFIVSNTDGTNVEILTPEEAETAGYASRTISLWMGGLGSGSSGQVLSGDYTDCTDTSPGGCQLIPFHGAWIELLSSSFNKTVKLLIPEE